MVVWCGVGSGEGGSGKGKAKREGARHNRFPPPPLSVAPLFLSCQVPQAHPRQCLPGMIASPSSTFKKQRERS